MSQTNDKTHNLIITDVSKNFDQIQVLRDISFSFDTGASIAITGPSGSGKSTLLHIIGTLEEPSKGQVIINGTDPFQLSESELAHYRNTVMGFVFQDHYLLPQYSVLENVLIPTLAFNKYPESTDRAQELLKSVGLSHRTTHKPAELSGGERQRVAIARALINNPSILLCDEPTGNLDTNTTTTISNLLFELHQAEQNILIVVTHNLELAQKFEYNLQLNDGVCSIKTDAHNHNAA